MIIGAPLPGGDDHSYREEHDRKKREEENEKKGKKTVYKSALEEHVTPSISIFKPSILIQFRVDDGRRASHTDQFELLEIASENDSENDLVAKVRRVSDSKVFECELSWLTTLDEGSPEFQYLDDFATWIADFQ